jgi:hypothetical protein
MSLGQKWQRTQVCKILSANAQGAHANFWEIGVVGFLLFSMYSHEILTMLPSSFQCIFNMFLKFFCGFHSLFPIAPHFNPNPLP